MENDPTSMYLWQTTNIEQLNKLIELVRSSLESIKHKIIVALITQDVHNRDIIEELAREEVNQISDFNW